MTYGIIETVKNSDIQAKGRAISDPASPSRSKNCGLLNPLLWVYFLNLLTPANPIRPRPRRSIVAGSGTGPGPGVQTSS